MAGSKKVSEFAREFKISSKDILENLARLGIELKSASSSVTEEQASLIADIAVRMREFTKEEIIEEKELAIEEERRAEAERAAEEAKKAAEEKAVENAEKPKPEVKSEAPNRERRDKKERPQRQDRPERPEKSERPEKTEKSGEEVKRERTPEKQEKTNAAKTQPAAKGKESRKKPQKQHKKQDGQRIDIEAMRTTTAGEAIVIKTDEKKRYVDTRSSSVEMDKIEKREKIEEMVSESRYDGGRKKVKKNKNKAQEQNKRNGRDARDNKKNKRNQPKPQPVVITEIEVPDYITVSELAEKMGKSPAEIVKKLFMSMGIMATVNQSIDYDTAELIAMEYEINVKKEIVLTKEDMLFQNIDVEDKEEDLVPRPPVVVVMGHVDHGKTSLLDAIRHTNVITTEAGGITQHIGAYSVKLNGRDITFLDTPGHEAFTTMRARGAQVTDVAILVVAADDGIMPQTIEAINHAKAAGVTIVVAINKIDKDNANPERVKQMLVEQGLVPEEWGGDTVCVEISAKKHLNIDGLLEMVLLVADMKELKANPDRAAMGAVIEAQIDKGRGPVATVLVQNGTLKLGDVVIAGTAVGRIRAMVNDKGRRVKTAPPSTPVEILGLSEAPSGGDKFYVVDNEKLAREVALKRKQDMQEDKFNQMSKVSLENLFSKIDEGNMKELDIIVKADVQGSVEAVKQSMEKLSNDEVRVKVIHGGVGAINESDVMLANASNAIIIGFNVRPDAGALSAAAQQEVDIRLYRVIYQAIEEIEAAMKGMLDPEYKEVVLGMAEIRSVFKVSGVGNIAGSYVTNGKIQRNAQIRVVRNGIIVHEGEIESLRRFKDDVKEVAEGFECGIGIRGFNDIKEGDVLECYVMEEIKR